VRADTCRISLDRDPKLVPLGRIQCHPRNSLVLFGKSTSAVTCIAGEPVHGQARELGRRHGRIGGIVSVVGTVKLKEMSPSARCLIPKFPLPPSLRT